MPMLSLAQQQELLAKIQQISSVDTFHQACESVALALECDYYLFCLFKPSGAMHSELFLDSNYPECWLNRYLDEGLIRLDPVVIHCQQHYVPTIWSTPSPLSDQLSQQVLADAQSIGLADGVTVPIHGKFGEFGLFSLSFNSGLSEVKRLELSIQTQMLTPYLQEAVSFFWEPLNNKCQLTDRERECLLWASEGKTTWEISHILSISESTVNFHLNNTIKKTKSVNRQQAIAKALMSGSLIHDPLASK